MTETGNEPAQLLIVAECLLESRKYVVGYVSANDFQAANAFERQSQGSANLIRRGAFASPLLAWC